MLSCSTSFLTCNGNQERAEDFTIIWALSVSGKFSAPLLFSYFYRRAEEFKLGAKKIYMLFIRYIKVPALPIMAGGWALRVRTIVNLYPHHHHAFWAYRGRGSVDKKLITKIN